MNEQTTTEPQETHPPRVIVGCSPMGGATVSVPPDLAAVWKGAPIGGPCEYVRRDLYDSIAAAIAALPAVTAGVRPLVWERMPAGSAWDWQAWCDLMRGYYYAGTDAQKREHEAVRAARILAAIEPQPAITVYECDGCGRMCRDPAADLKTLREGGKLSCCPERKMLPLSAIDPTPAPTALAVPEVAALVEAAERMVQRAKETDIYRCYSEAEFLEEALAALRGEGSP